MNLERIDYYKEIVTQTLTVSAILAGFGFAFIIELATSEIRTKIASTILALVSGATLSLIVCPVLGSIFLFATPLVRERAGAFTRYETLLEVIWSAFALGMILILVVIALSGFLRSRFVDLWTASLAAISFAIMLAFYVYFALAFNPANV